MIARLSWILVYPATLKEIQLIREYELIMLNYSEDKAGAFGTGHGGDGFSPSLGN